MFTVDGLPPGGDYSFFHYTNWQRSNSRHKSTKNIVRVRSTESFVKNSRVAALWRKMNGTSWSWEKAKHSIVTFASFPFGKFLSVCTNVCNSFPFWTFDWKWWEIVQLLPFCHFGISRTQIKLNWVFLNAFQCTLMPLSCDFLLKNAQIKCALIGFPLSCA